MNLGADLHVLILFDKQGREIYRGPRTRNTTRPVLGASYLIEPDTELIFKPYRQTNPFRGLASCCSTSTRRPSNVQILATAKQFSSDGEEDNALAMLQLLKVSL